MRAAIYARYSSDLQALNGAPYVSVTSGFVTVLAMWIGQQSKQPMLDAQVYVSVLETLVEAIAARGGASDVAA
jgi:hypothetical protein